MKAHSQKDSERGRTVPPQPGPRLSIILCTYNRRRLVLTALASLRQQTLSYEQYEVIVIDNGSADGTFEAIQAYIDPGARPAREPEHAWRVRCLQEGRNGLTNARRKGLQIAVGEIVVFLDDDTLAAPTFLECLLEAYEQTGADAMSGRVNLSWEARRPYWLSDALLCRLGYFAPGEERCELPEQLCFSNSCFSVKMAALQGIGSVRPFLSKRLNAPLNIEGEDICRRLRQAGYSLWYEPAAVVTHRVPAARLQRAFFLGRAYWQGRAEVLNQYFEHSQYQETAHFTFKYALEIVRPELRKVMRSLLFWRPLLSLAGQSSSERLLAEMEQAYNWGRIRQIWQIIERAPTSFAAPSVLLIHGGEKSAWFLEQGLREQEARCIASTGAIPLSWLWRHRAYLGQAIAVIHIYRPGALDLSYWRRHVFWLKLWLARLLGIRIVSTDAGGWWQHMRGLRFLWRRQFEDEVLAYSDRVVAYTHHPEQLYASPHLARGVRGLPHPGLRGYYPRMVEQAQAYRQLGLPEQTGFVYLCLAYLHSEGEVQVMIDAFCEAYQRLRRKKNEAPSPATNPQLLIMGKIRDGGKMTGLLKRAALNPAIHLFLETGEEDTALGLAAANGLVLPYQALPHAGLPEIAMLAYSYGRLVIAPDLPRFRDMLPAHAIVSFDPARSESLVGALLKARTKKFQLDKQEQQELGIRQSWKEHAGYVLEIYQEVLGHHHA